MYNNKNLLVLLRYLWLPILLGGFIISFDLKYNLVGATFAILIFQSGIGLSFTLSRNVNLLSIYYLFTLVFFGMVPWLHYSADIALWRSSLAFDSTYIILNITIIIANLVVSVVYSISLKKSKVTSFSLKFEKIKMPAQFLLLLLSGLGFGLVFYVNDFSLPNLLFRGFVDENKNIVVDSSSFALIIELGGRLTPVFCFFYAATKMEGRLITKSVLFFLMILSVFPTGVARYMAAFAYIPLVLLFVPIMRNASLFAATLLFSIAFLFPFLNQFRYFSGVENLILLPQAEFFYAAHFDAHENFASAIESNFISYGYQLSGSLLFFVPRFIWPGKPVGSGYEMAERLGYSFNNISMPLLAEGYVNFGFFGVFLFAVCIGYFMARMDGYYSLYIKLILKSDYSTAIYYYIIGALFFLLRGDLLSSFAYIVAGLLVALFIERLMMFSNSIKFIK